MDTAEEKNKNLIIRMFHVQKSYGAKKALIDINLDIYQNEFLFVTGPSGAGKTTLLKLLYLGEPASGGQILVDGMNLSRIPAKRAPFLRRKFGVIFQDYKLIASKTVFDNIALVLEATGTKRKLIAKKVNGVLRMVDMEDKGDMLPPSLSGGEQQRIAVARAVVGNPRIILADEPTGSLDPESADIIFGLLARFHMLGGTLVVATHDRGLLQKPGCRIIQLKQGQMANQDDPHSEHVA